jgi:cobalamin synthase
VLPRWSALSPLAAAALAVTATAVLTRGLHLDGLADTADGLGSRRPGEEALVLMRRGDVGPFGVATLVLTLLVQVAALAACFEAGVGPFALVTALVVSRAALPLACRPGVPAARPDGLGASVAGTVGGSGLLLALMLTVAALGLAAAVASAGAWGPDLAGFSGLTGWDDGSGTWPVLRPVLAVLLPWLMTWLWTRHCVRRLGGVSGDVLGSTVEVACTTSLLLFSLS